MAALTTEEQINRLTLLSKTHPVLPDEFIPWGNEINTSEVYMPGYLFSLNECDLLNDLNKDQVVRLQKLEVSQIMATYAWSESMGCVVFNELLLKVTPTSPEGKYLVSMLIEEYRHQYMFVRLIDKLEVKPQPFSRFHRFLLNFSIRVLSTGSKYLVALAIEQVTDMYGKHFRKGQNVYSVFRKACELHHIEEGRHMAFQKICLEKYITNAGFIKRTKLGIYYAITIWFMRSQYIKEVFFVDIGVDNPKRYYKVAVKNYRKLFSQYCLKDSMEYAKSLGLANSITKPFWNLILKVKL